MKSLSKARDILSLVAREPGIGLPDISRNLAMPKSTTYRILRALEEGEFVVQTAHDHCYFIGPLIKGLINAPKARENLISCAHSLMVQLRDVCDETVALHVLEAGSWVTIDQVESTQELRRTITKIGLPMPLHAAATGKLFLAYMSESQRRMYLHRHELRRFAPGTITNRRRLVEALDEIKSKGYALSFQEVALGVAGISMPLRSSDGDVTAAIGVSGPISRFTPKAIVTIRNALRVATMEVESRLDLRDTTSLPTQRRSTSRLERSVTRHKRQMSVS